MIWEKVERVRENPGISVLVLVTILFLTLWVTLSHHYHSMWNRYSCLGVQSEAEHWDAMFVWLVFCAKVSFGRKIRTVGGNGTAFTVGARGYHSSHITKPKLMGLGAKPTYVRGWLCCLSYPLGSFSHLKPGSCSWAYNTLQADSPNSLLQPYQMLLSLPQPEKTTVCTSAGFSYTSNNFLCSVPSPQSLLPTTPLLFTDNLSQILSASRSLPCLGVGLHSVQLLIFLSATL